MTFIEAYCLSVPVDSPEAAGRILPLDPVLSLIDFIQLLTDSTPVTNSLTHQHLPNSNTETSISNNLLMKFSN